MGGFLFIGAWLVWGNWDSSKAVVVQVHDTYGPSLVLA